MSKRNSSSCSSASGIQSSDSSASTSTAKLPPFSPPSNDISNITSKKSGTSTTSLFYPGQEYNDNSSSAKTYDISIGDLGSSYKSNFSPRVSMEDVLFDQTATLNYKPLPRSGTFILDHRRNRIVIEDGYSPEGTDYKIRFELLDQNDIEFMTQFATEHFVENSSICRHLQMKGEEFIELVHPLVINWIKCQNSAIVKHDEKIIGVAFGSYHTREEFNDLYRGQLFHEKPEFVIKDDYGEDIRNGPFKSHNVNRVAVLLKEMELQTGKFLPKDTEKLGVHELTAIHPSYTHYGLATKSAETIRKIMIEQGCTHEAGYCVATGTWKMSKKFGHHDIFSLPYDRFLENGKPVFENLNDHAKAAYTTFLDYKKDKTAGKY